VGLFVLDFFSLIIILNTTEPVEALITAGTKSINIKQRPMIWFLQGGKILGV